MAQPWEQDWSKPATAKADDNAALPWERNWSAPPTKAEDTGNVGRGFKEAFQQVPQLGYGLLAGTGAAIESAFGEGGIGTGLKKAGVKGYTEWGDKIAAGSKESDSFDYSWDRAKEGDIGALGAWIAHGLGYAGGQAVQMLATAGLGAVAGKATLGTVAKSLAEGMVQKEAAALAATDAAKSLTAEQVTKLATQAVASKLGQTAAIGASAFGMEGGEIFGDLAQEATKEGRTLTGTELAKAFGATLAAGGLEFVGDKVGLDVMLGKSKLLKPAEAVTGMKGRAARAGVAALGAAPIEGATEYGQTLLEESGKGHDPFSDESLKQAKDAAALGALGGAAMGGAGGVLQSAKPKPGVKDILAAPSIDDAIQFSTEALKTDKAPDLTLAEPAKTAADGLDFEADPRFAGAPVFPNGAAPSQPIFSSKTLADIHIGEQGAMGQLQAVQIAPDKWTIGQTEQAANAAMRRNIEQWMARAQPMNEEAAAAAVKNAADQLNKQMVALPMPDGQGWTVVPKAWVNAPGLSDYMEHANAAREAQAQIDADRPPVGEATEVPFIPTGEATEVERIPTGEASELLPTGEATEVPRKIATGKASEPDAGLVETIHADDLLTGDGVPYGSKVGANIRAKREGLTPNHVVEIPGAGWVIRPNLSVRSQPQQAPINAQPNNTRGTTAADVIQGPRDANRTDVGGNQGRGTADGGAGTGAGSVVQGQQPATAADGTAAQPGGGAAERAGAVPTGPGRGHDALSPDSFAGSIKSEIDRRAAADAARQRKTQKQPIPQPRPETPEQPYRAAQRADGFVLENDDGVIGAPGGSGERKFKSPSEAASFAKANGLPFVTNPAQPTVGANEALKPGATFTLDGKAWTVQEVKDSAVAVRDAENNTRMVARNSKTFQKITAALQPTATAPEPASAETNPQPQGAQADEVTIPQQEKQVQTVAGALAPAAQTAEKPQHFKSKAGAIKAQREAGNTLKVQKVKDGFILRQKTDKELAAEQAAGQRLRRGTNANGTLLNAIAQLGGLAMSERADTIGSGNKNLGGKMLFRNGGQSIDTLANEALHEMGYIPPEEHAKDGGVSWLRDAIAAEFMGTRTHYSQHSDSWMKAAEEEARQRADDFAAAQAEREAAPDYDPFSDPYNQGSGDPLAEFTSDDLTQAGYTGVSPEVQAVTERLLAEAEAAGLDTEAIIERVAMSTDGATEHDYHTAIQAEITRLLARDSGGVQGADASRAEASPAGDGKAAEEARGSQEGEGLTPLEAAAYLKDFVYSLGSLGLSDKAQVSLSSPLGKSGRDNLLMAAFGITRDQAHSLNNGLDARQPKKLRAVDMQDALRMFPGLREMIDAAQSKYPNAEGLTLEAQTAEDLKAKATREEAAARAEKAKRDADQARLKKEAEARDDKARADQTVDDFQLGQSAEQQMSGMGDLFAESAQASTPQSDRYEAGRALTKEQRKQVLGTLVDVYKAKGAEREQKGVGRDGNERFGYVHSPELFEKSDITGAMVRYYVTLPDGRKAHPTELFPDYTQADIDSEMAARAARARDRAEDVKRATVPAQQFSTVREAVEWWDKRSAASARTATGLPTIFPSEERRPLTDGAKFILIPNTTSGEMLEAFADAGWVPQRAQQPAPAEAATTILDAAGVTGKERLDALKDVKAGTVTPEELAAAYPAKQEAEPAEPTPVEAKQEPEPTSPAEVENFGEALPPARRNMAAKLSEDLSDGDIASKPLSEIWPLAENEAIEDTFAAAVAHAARAEIPAKPRVAYKVKGWVQKVKMLRDLAGKIVSGTVTRERMAENIKTEFRSLADWWSKVMLLEQIDRSQWKRIGEVMERPESYSYEDGKQVSTPMVRVQVDGKSHWLRGDAGVEGDARGTIAGNRAGLMALLGTDAPQQRMEFDIRTRRKDGSVFINKKGDGQYRPLMEFATVADARKAITEQYDALVAAWEGIKARDNITERDLRSAENRPRAGRDHRQGRDVTPQEFQDQFGFRGGEFGKWVQQGKGDKERQAILNDAYDALMDLSDLLGIPPRAISLNGTLGIAFGSRGSGWASAHFEPSNLVINLTKTRGAGALGHEWFHALDNYFSRIRRGGKEAPFNGSQRGYRDDNYITHRPEPLMVHKTQASTPITRGRLEAYHAANPKSGYYNPENWKTDPKHPVGVRPEVEARFAALVQALDRSPMSQRAKTLDGIKESGDGYWSRTLERAARAFENYLQGKMQDEGYHNDFLANVVPSQDTGRNPDRYPYLLPDELKPIREAFDALFNEVQSREDDRGNVALFSRATDTIHLDQSDAIGREFWRKIKEGETFTEQEVLNALSINRRGSRRDARSLEVTPGGPTTGESIVHWSGEIAGFDGYRTSAAWVADSFTVFVIPEELAAGADLSDSTQARDRAIVAYAFTPLRGGLYELAINDVAPDSTAENALRERGKLQDAGIESNPYRRVDIGHTLSRALLQESIRRLAINIGQTPSVYYAQRDTGARAGQDESGRGFDAERVERNFSRSGRTGRGISITDAEAIAADIRATMPTAPQIVVVESVSQLPDKLRALIEQAGADNDVEGVYWGGKVYAVTAHFSDLDRFRFVVAHHELRHHGFGAMLGPRLHRMMMQIYRSNAKVRALADQNIRDGIAKDVVVATEEALADMPVEDLVKLRGWQRIVAAVREFLRNLSMKLEKRHPKLADMLRPEGWTDEDIARLISRAEDMSRTGEPDYVRGGAVFSQPADQTKSEAFRKWFGDSKVVDANGKPLVVYHGTDADFEQFKASGANYIGGFKTSGAIYLTPSAASASWAATELPRRKGREGGSPNVMPLYVAMRKPYITASWSAYPSKMTMAALKLRGFDGIVVSSTGRVSDATEILAFKPEQIKSAIGNNGEFNPGSADIRFSRARPNVTTATAPSAMAEALQSFGDTKLPGDYIVSDFIKTHGKLSWWDKTVGSMHNLAQRNPLFKPVYDRAQDFLNAVSTFATEAADLAPTLLPKLEGLRDLGKSPLSAEDTKAISAPIFEGTLLWTRDENGQIVREEDPQKAGVVWRDDELRSRYKLNDHQIKLYREFRAATNKSLTDMTIADMIRFGGADVLAVRDRAMALGDVTAAGNLLAEHLTRMADEDSDRAGVLIDTAGRIMGKAEQAVNLMSRGYAPLTRFGHYTMDVTDAEGQRVYFGLFESQAEANRFARKMRAAYPDGTIQQGTLSQEAYKMFAGISPETAELFGQMLGLEAQGDDAASRAFQEYLKLAKSNRSAMKRLIERKGIAGFSEDAGRVLAGFVYSNARQAAKNLHMGAMNDAVQAIAKAKGKGELLDTAVRLHQYIANPVEEAQKIKGLMFTQFLGGSLAAGLVNLSQVPMVTFPYLSQFGGAAKAAANLKRGLSDALKWETAKTDAQRTTGDAGLDLALKRAEEDGIVSPQEIHSLIAQANGAGALKAGDGTKAGNLAAKGSNFLSKLGLVWGKPFAIAEQFNRRATFIAAYRTAVEQSMPNPAQFAEQAVTETQFSYTKANRPEWARGALGSVLFTFKTYSISYVELLYRMAKSGPEGKKAALLALGVMFLMAGMQGLPGADDLDDIIDGIMQRLGYNFSSKQAKREFFAKLMGEGGAQFMMRGVSGLPGAPIDVANRLGLGNLIPGTGLLTKKADHTSDVTEIGGPALSFGKQLLTGADQLTQGNFGKAVESVLPVAAANAWKAIDMASSGMYRDQLGRKVIDTDGYDALVKAIGFQPNDVSKVQTASREVQQMVGLNKMRESEIADQWAQAIFDNDTAGKEAARQALEAWNRDNPESPIKITTAQLLTRLKNMRLDKIKRMENTAPKEIRATVHRELAEAR